MNIFIKQLRNKRDELTPLEKKVLDFILDKPKEVLNSNLEELASKTYCSTATISRMCQKLSYEGYSEFKFALSKSDKHVKQDKDKYASEDNHIEYLDQIKAELNFNIKNIASIDFDCVLELLHLSKRVELFGTGRSFSVCQEAARKFTFTGCLSYARSDWDELRMTASYMKSDDLAILVSMSGETIHLLEYASILSENKVPTIALIGTKDSSLEQLVDHTVHLEIENTRYHNIDISSHFLFSIVIDIISMKYLTKYREV